MLELYEPLVYDVRDLDDAGLQVLSANLDRALERHGVPHIYEEFPDDHSSVDYRMDRSLPVLAKALGRNRVSAYQGS